MKRAERPEAAGGRTNLQAWSLPFRRDFTSLCQGAVPPATAVTLCSWWNAAGHQTRQHVASTFKFSSLFRALGRITGAVGISADARELAALDDKIFISDWLVREIALEDLAYAGCIPRLR